MRGKDPAGRIMPRARGTSVLMIQLISLLLCAHTRSAAVVRSLALLQ